MDNLKTFFLISIFFLIIALLQKKYCFSNKTRNLFLLISLVPLFLIGGLFPVDYMWDIIVYERNVSNIRNYNFDDIRPKTISVYTWSYLLSILPLPFMDSPLRIGFASKLIYILFIIFLIRKKNLYENELLFYFLIFWPSALIYTSLGLREGLVLISCYFGFYFLIQKQYFVYIIFLTLIFLIKTPSFVLVIISSAMYVLFFKIKNFKFTLISLSLIFSIIVFVYLSEVIIDKLNHHRFALYLEDEKPESMYKKLYYNFELIKIILSSGPKFMFSPKYTEISNYFRAFQFIENIVVFVFIIYYIIKGFKIDRTKTIFWFFQMYIWITVYGLVSFNPGSIARWKFHLIALFFLLINLDVVSKYKKKYIKKFTY